MPAITITEKYNEQYSAAEDLQNIVYIPGFTDLDLNINPDVMDPAYVPGMADAEGMPPRVPKLCRTLEEFKRYFGSKVPQFKEDQDYPKLNANSGISGFIEDALTGGNGGTMFKKGDADPSYRYAVQLLSMGIPVIYERVNEIKLNNFEEVESEADLPKTTLIGNTAYCKDNGILYVAVSGGVDSPESAIWKEYKLYDTLETESSNLVVEFINCEISVQTMYNFLEERFCGNLIDNPLLDKDQYDIKYVTSGGYPTYEYMSIEKDTTRNPATVISHNFRDKAAYDSAVNSIDATSKELVLTDVADLPTLKQSEYIQVQGTYDVVVEGAEAEGATTTVKHDYIIRGSFKSAQSKTRSTKSDVTIIVESTKCDSDSDWETYRDTPYYGLPFEYNHIIAQGMLDLAAERGDIIALIDHTNNKYRPVHGSNSVFASLNNSEVPLGIHGEYGAMFTPWIIFNELGPQPVAPSFAYLITLAANASNSTASWLAIAGTDRGVLPGKPHQALAATQKITPAVVEQYKPEIGISLNPITHLRNRGLTIWGDRTLRQNGNDVCSSSFLNLRDLLSELKKEVYRAAQSLMFEQNNDILWINFRSKLIPILDKMVATGGLSSYSINSIATGDPTKLSVQIRLVPVFPVESFEVTIELTDQFVDIVEE